MKSLARSQGLITTETAEGLIVHDPDRNETHRLSSVAGLVYRHANGHNSVANLVTLVRAGLRRAVSREMIFSALDQLSEAGLLVQSAGAAASAGQGQPEAAAAASAG